MLIINIYASICKILLTGVEADPELGSYLSYSPLQTPSIFFLYAYSCSPVDSIPLGSVEAFYRTFFYHTL